MRCARSWPPRPAPAARPGAPTSACPVRSRRRPTPQGVASVNARDRIGNGPWYNAKGELIARDLAPPAQRQQPQQGDGARREGQRRQRPRRHAQRARHPDRLARRRHRLRAADRHHLQGLDEQHRRLGDRRPPRPHRPAARELGQVLELLAPVGRLQPGSAGAHRRLGAACTASPATDACPRPAASGPRAAVGALLSLRQTGSGFKGRRASSAAVARWRQPRSPAHARGRAASGRQRCLVNTDQADPQPACREWGLRPRAAAIALQRALAVCRNERLGDGRQRMVGKRIREVKEEPGRETGRGPGRIRFPTVLGMHRRWSGDRQQSGAGGPWAHDDAACVDQQPDAGRATWPSRPSAR